MLLISEVSSLLLQAELQGASTQHAEHAETKASIAHDTPTLKAQYATCLHKLFMPHSLLRMTKTLVFTLCVYFVSFILTYLFLQKRGLL